MNNDLITFMEYIWLSISDDVITVGIFDTAMEDFDEITKAHLPEDGTILSANEACAELETDQGPINIYSPVDGEVIEVNEAVLQNPNIIQDDCFGDGWVLKIKSEDFSQIEKLSQIEHTDVDTDYEDPIE